MFVDWCKYIDTIANGNIGYKEKEAYTLKVRLYVDTTFDKSY